MITVHAKLYATLRKYQPQLAPGESLAVELANGSTLLDLLAKLGVPENETKQVFVKGRQQPMDYVLRDGEEAGIFPPIAGGNNQEIMPIPKSQTLLRHSTREATTTIRSVDPIGDVKS